jgi:hypothetical protein
VCCQHRYLQWDSSAQIALIKIWLAEKMEITVPEVTSRHSKLIHCCSVMRRRQLLRGRAGQHAAAVAAGLAGRPGTSPISTHTSALDTKYAAVPAAAVCEQVEEQLAELGNLLPDIVGKMDRARADVLYDLLKDPAATAHRLLALRELLPRCNVSALVAGHPKLLLGMTVSSEGQQRLFKR